MKNVEKIHSHTHTYTKALSRQTYTEWVHEFEFDVHQNIIHSVWIRRKKKLYTKRSIRLWARRMTGKGRNISCAYRGFLALYVRLLGRLLGLYYGTTDTLGTQKSLLEMLTIAVSFLQFFSVFLLFALVVWYDAIPTSQLSWLTACYHAKGLIQQQNCTNSQTQQVKSIKLCERKKWVQHQHQYRRCGQHIHSNKMQTHTRSLNANCATAMKTMP